VFLVKLLVVIVGPKIAEEDFYEDVLRRRRKNRRLLKPDVKFSVVILFSLYF
jgi:hypothetical protein